MSVIVLYICIIHYIYATALIIEPSAVGITAISSIVWICQNRVMTSTAFLVVASLAILGMSVSSSIGVLLMLPQQTLLIISAAGAVDAMVSGQFADGVVRPYWFLIADQSPTVVAALCHTIAMARVKKAPWIGSRS